VLELGCGSGREAAFLRQVGHDVKGVDASQEIIEEALRRHPELAGRLSCQAVPLPEERLTESQMCVATYRKSGVRSAARGRPSPSSMTLRYSSPRASPCTMVMVRACASMLFSTNSAMALYGLFCDKAMIVMAFHASPMRTRPLVALAPTVALRARPAGAAGFLPICCRSTPRNSSVQATSAIGDFAGLEAFSVLGSALGTQFQAESSPHAGCGPRGCFQDFDADRMLALSLIKLIDWQDIVSMRNRLVHAYLGIR
jgi:hypothetical protein